MDSSFERKREVLHTATIGCQSSDLVITSNAERIQAADWRLNELEEMMGQHEYLNRARGDLLEMGFIATARTLNTRAE